jgi:hypothetical protein
LDYDISYQPGKAVFEGVTKVIDWLPDNPPQDGEIPEPGAPRHPEEDISMRDTRDFEILLDKQSGYAGLVRYVNSNAAALTLTYTNSGKLSAVNDYSVVTDNKGNILSMLSPKSNDPYGTGQQLGITYSYAEGNGSNRKHQYYESPFIFIHPMFSLLEVLDWGPFQPNKERTGFYIQHNYEDPELGEYPIPLPFVTAQYTEHIYDASGNLISYTYDGDLTQDFPFPVNHETAQIKRTIVWNCNGKVTKYR